MNRLYRRLESSLVLLRPIRFATVASSGVFKESGKIFRNLGQFDFALEIMIHLLTYRKHFTVSLM